MTSIVFVTNWSWFTAHNNCYCYTASQYCYCYTASQSCYCYTASQYWYCYTACQSCYQSQCFATWHNLFSNKALSQNHGGIPAVPVYCTIMIIIYLLTLPYTLLWNCGNSSCISGLVYYYNHQSFTSSIKYINLELWKSSCSSGLVYY